VQRDDGLETRRRVVAEEHELVAVEFPHVEHFHAASRLDSLIQAAYAAELVGASQKLLQRRS